MTDELEATGRNVYLLQKSLGEMVAERDKLLAVCQPIFVAVEREEMPSRTQVADIHRAMKRYNKK